MSRANDVRMSEGLTPLGTSGLTYLDVLPGSPREALEELSAIHLDYFGDSYAEATRDFRKVWEGAASNSEIIDHQWLLHFDGVPCGELVFSINLQRRMVDRHFTSIRKEFRQRLPEQWIPSVTRAVTDSSLESAERRGVQLLGMMSEIMPKHVAGWRKWGLYQPDIGYCEPLHGNYWRDFGELEYVPMVANILPFPAGDDAGLGVVAEAGVRSFLLDYYGVPETDSTFQGIIERCQGLSSAW